MKTITFWSILMLCSLLCGCVNHINEKEEEVTGEEKTILFKTSFSVEQTPMRTIQETVTKIAVSDYQDGTEVQTVEQTSTDNEFGKISMQLKYGKHELLFVGHNSDNCNLSYTSVTFDKVTDTFSYYLDLTIDDATQPTQSVILNRSVGLLKIVANDAIPSDVAQLQVSLSKYYPALNAKTNLSEGNPESLKKTFDYKTTHVGVKGSTYSIYSFIPENGFSTDVTITSIDTKGNTLYTTTLKDINIENNRQTILSGNIFKSGIDLTISVNSQWGENIEYPI